MSLHLHCIGDPDQGPGAGGLPYRVLSNKNTKILFAKSVLLPDSPMLHCGHCQGDQEEMVVANFRSSLNFRLTFSSNFTQAGI